MKSPILNRRQSIRSLAAGGLLLPGVLSEMMQGATMPADPLAPQPPHFPAKAKRVIFLFMTGGVSHVDTFDPKPFLTQNHGKSSASEKRRGKNFYKGSDWEFRRYGKSGTEVSDLFPQLGSMVDDIGVIRAVERHYHNGARLEKAEVQWYFEKFSPWCTVATWYLWRSLDPIPVEY